MAYASLSLNGLKALAQRVPPYSVDYHTPTNPPASPSDAASATTWEDVLTHVAAARGVSTASVMAAQYQSRQGVTVVPFDDAQTIEYGLLWPTNAETPKVKAFVKAILDTQPPASPEE